VSRELAFWLGNAVPALPESEERMRVFDPNEMMLWQHQRVDVGNLEVVVEDYKAFELGSEQENLRYVAEEAECFIEDSQEGMSRDFSV